MREKISVGGSLFPGWLVALGCLVTTTVEGGLWFSQGLFFKPLAETFGWTRTETSLANTIFMLAYGSSMVVMGRLADLYGTRRIMAVAAGMVGAALMLHSPQQKGLKPYGWAEAEASPGDFPVWSERDMSTGQALRHRTFWWLLGVILMGQIPVMFLTVHLVPYATDQGISRTMAAGALGLVGALSIPGRLIMGGLADRIGWKLSFALANYGAAAGMLSLSVVQGPLTLYFAVALYGFFHGARVPPTAGLSSFFFGTRSLSELIGILMGTGILVSAFAPLAAGFVFDRVGSYLAVLLLASLCLGLSGFLLHFIPSPRGIEKGPGST